MSNLAIDGAEAKLLLAELSAFINELGVNETERRIGRRIDGRFRLFDVRDYPGPEFRMRLVPTRELERALAMLWS